MCVCASQHLELCVRDTIQGQQLAVCVFARVLTLACVSLFPTVDMFALIWPNTATSNCFASLFCSFRSQHISRVAAWKPLCFLVTKTYCCCISTCSAANVYCQTLYAVCSMESVSKRSIYSWLRTHTLVWRFTHERLDSRPLFPPGLVGSPEI